MGKKRKHNENPSQAEPSDKRVKVEPKNPLDSLRHGSSVSAYSGSVHDLKPRYMSPSNAGHNHDTEGHEVKPTITDRTLSRVAPERFLAGSPTLPSYLGVPKKAALPPYNGHRSTLPPLPPIQDESLALVPFTLPAFYHSSTNDKLHTTYDRLEFLGDAYIEVIASRFVFSLYPELRAGRLSQQRESWVKNETLAQFALAYQFDKRARGLPDDLIKFDPKQYTKTLGDIFEAYVAAIILDDPQQGLQTAEAWLTSLWASKLPQQDKPESGVQSIDLTAKQELAKMVMGKGVKLDYRDEKEPEQIKKVGKVLYSVGVYITGWGWENQHLGSGRALSKKEGGNIAAAEARKNPLTEEIMAVKKKFDGKVAIERVEEKETFVSLKNILKEEI